MFHVVRKINLLSISTETLNNSYTNLQTVRWRKPRWVPIAKSKKFRIPTRVVIPEDEAAEIKRLNNNYHTFMKSIRRYLNNKYNTILHTSSDHEEILKLFREDFERCFAINEKWNAEQKIHREKRIADQLEEELEFARKRIELEIRKEEKKLELVEEIVRNQKAASVNFITAENIDKAIDDALAQESDYNFALNVNGEKIVGRENRPDMDNKVAIKQ